jgi:hypothetical protein
MVEIATVSAADAIDDHGWFSRHPQRRYRVRPGWVVRRRGGVFLRAVILPSDPVYRGDDEGSAEAAWWASAYPHLSPEARAQMAREARRAAKAATHKPSNAKRRQGGRPARFSPTPQGSKP